MNRPLVSFVIPVKNDAARLDRCLASIRANDYPADRVEIVVADNGSTDASAEVARSRQATVLSLPGIRLGALRNTAAKAARGEVLAFVDADHEIARGWVTAAVAALQNANVAAAGDACRPPQPGTWVQRTYDRLRRHVTATQPVEWLGSGNMAMKRTAFESVGGFDESLETCEDVDLCRKLRGRGFEIVADPRMENVHYGDPRTLGHVFFGELWRGRDNVRVSLRPPRDWRTIASAAIPIVILAGTVAAILGLFAMPWIGPAPAAAGLLVVTGAITARAARMRPDARGWPAAVSVAAAYEMGRALAVIARPAYGLRRKVVSVDA